MRGRSRFGIALAACLTLAAAPAGKSKSDGDNPSCPGDPGWGAAQAIALTTATRGGKRVLIADGIIEGSFPARLKAAIDADEKIEEIWLKSRGGDARAGNAAGRVVRSFPGMATRIPDPTALAMILKGAARIVTVTDDEVRDAIRAYWTDTHNLAEGAGAAPFAALMQERASMQGKRVATILCGGNIDLALFRDWVLA